jgi:serine/threonine-protein kinase HipA
MVTSSVPTPDAVNIHFGDTHIATLRRDTGAAHGHTFEWNPEYLDRVAQGRRLIPDKLPADACIPVKAGAQRYNTNQSFGDLPGFLWDSLPDSWGNLVMERAFKSLGQARPPSVIQKLVYVGNRGMGGLRFRPALGTSEEQPEYASRIEFARLKAMAEQISVLSADHGEEIKLDSLTRAAGTAGGAHAKCLVALGRDNSAAWASDTDFLEQRPELKPCILKIGGVSAASGLPPEYLANCTRIEHAYGLMAKDAGLSPSPMTLIEAGGLWHLAIERFDRRGHRRLHHMTYAAANQELHAHGQAWYSEIPQNLAVPVVGIAGIEDIYRRAVFNYAAHVTDDHLKNHGILLSSGKWAVSPPYDLVWSPGERHSTRISGAETAADLTGDFLGGLAEVCGIEKAEAKRICGEVLEAISYWTKFAHESAVEPSMVDTVGKSLDRCLRAVQLASKDLGQ